MVMVSGVLVGTSEGPESALVDELAGDDVLEEPDAPVALFDDPDAPVELLDLGEEEV